jgi:hypothetical protein
MTRNRLLLGIGVLVVVVCDGRAQDTAATAQLNAGGAKFNPDIGEVPRACTRRWATADPRRDHRAGVSATMGA